MAQHIGPNIVTDNLTFHIDAVDKKSYPGSGTTWYDLSAGGPAAGGKHNVTLVHAPTLTTDGGGSFDFDGSNDYGTTTYGIPGTDRTMCVWVKYDTLDNAASNNHQLMGIQQVGGKYTYIGLDDGNGYPYYYLGDDGQAVTTSVLAINTWYHQAMTLASTAIAVYTNGQLVHTDTTSTNATATDTYTISALDGGGYKLNGKIANVSLYNKGLSTAEIKQNFNAHRSRFGV